MSTDYQLPPITLLEKGKAFEGEAQNFIDASKNILQSTLDSFGIQGKVISYVTGPRVTRYEISLDPGVKVERISNLANNFAMDLQAESVRILAPIPGKNTVGIEVPNSKVSFISIRSIMESGPWNAPNIEIPIILGADVSGRPVVTDLSRAPHLLIAGAMGTGKSVCIHSLIMSLLYRFTPDELKLIMTDTKRVEYGIYAHLLHLITPVVTDSKKVPAVLQWCVNEMERRYGILSKTNSRKLSDFNRREKTPVPILDDDGNELPDKMPILVIIIDELADIMMTEAKTSVENSIARIAQKGRAAGIHMVIATQTPRKEIITGVIKANLPTRVAFQVSSIVDSGVILDRKGAEKLLGRGDMLFLPPGSSNLDRIQGTLVSDKEIEKVVTFVSEQSEQTFDETVLSGNATELEAELPIGEGSEGEDGDLFGGDSEEDLLERAIQAVLTGGKASTSYVHRRLGIGYNKAASLVEIMEKKGIVSPPVGASAKREILVSLNDYINYSGVQQVQGYEKLSETQLEQFLRLLQTVLQDIRFLLRLGNVKQAEELSELFHNFPLFDRNMEILASALPLKLIKIYQIQYGKSEDTFCRDYCSMVENIIGYELKKTDIDCVKKTGDAMAYDSTGNIKMI